MDSTFMPMGLDSTLYSSRSTQRTTSSNQEIIDQLIRDGYEINEPGEDVGLDFTDYLQLMIQQLQNQTIDNTTDTSDMLNQMVQMSVVEMMTKVQTSIDTLVDANTLNYAASLVGKTVTVGQYNSNNEIEEIVGTVTGTGTYQGAQVIFLDNGGMYALNEIMAIGTLPEVPETPETGDGETTGGDEGGTGTDGSGETDGTQAAG